jgi:methionyl-tRNA formyltransferase
MVEFGAKMKVLLLALTGMGNETLHALTRSRHVTDILVVTRQEKGDYPYYPCRQLAEVCAANGVDCLVKDMRGPEGTQVASRFAPDILAVTTFHHILPRMLLDTADIAVNMHPSILPAYRGPTPTNWAVIHGAPSSGVTLHHLEEDLDAGDIILQREVEITGLTDGEVRKRLNAAAGACLAEFLEDYSRKHIEATPQCEASQTYFPNIASARGRALLLQGNFHPDNILRGVTPYPGAPYLLHEDFHGFFESIVQHK